MTDDLPKILVVDDSKMFVKVLVQSLEQTVDCTVFSAESMEKARLLLDAHEFDVAMLDLNLPDAPQGEVVDLALERGIPVIVFAGDCTDQTRNRLWSKNIVDYVVKEGGESLNHAIRQARRVIMNRAVKALVVEDSDMVRSMVSGLLRVHRFQVLEAVNGREAMRVMSANPDIRLVITDYEMPEMDGLRFVRLVRARHPRDEVAIIGISSHELESLSARFLKSGANDFLNKPFTSEEFYCRVTQNMDLLEYIQSIKDFSEKDFLTGLFNRRYLFANAPSRIRKRRKQGGAASLAMLDIDHFKKINDRFGHETGDAVLKDLGERLRQRFGEKGIAARLGGEEFCLLLDGDEKDVVCELEEFRRYVAATPVHCCGTTVSCSLSAGLCVSGRMDLESLIRKADEMLYLAKEKGRNRLEVWRDDD
jgi:diguanylate cyclase (GGDEF)-like protein